MKLNISRYTFLEFGLPNDNVHAIKKKLLNCLGCKLLMFCGAFNLTTGPAHWELLIRARALDSQAYFAATSLARDDSASYVSYGHSMVVDPW